MGGGSKNVLKNLEGLEKKRERTRRSVLLVQKEWESYSANLEEAQRNLAKGFTELKAKEIELELEKKSVSERSKELDLVRESMDERLKRAGEEEKAFLAIHGSLMQELELKCKELDLIAKNYADEVKSREEKLKEQTKMVEGIFEKMDSEKKEIERVQEMVEEKILQLENDRNGDINCLLTWIMKKQNERESNDLEIDPDEGKLEEPVSDLMSKKKKLLEQELELDLKEHVLEVLAEELELKKKETDLFQELSKKHVKGLMHREKELDSREKQIESVKKFTQKCYRAYCSGRKEWRLKMQFLENEGKKLEERTNELEYRIKEVELREKELDLIEKQCREFLAARLNAGIVENVEDKERVNTWSSSSYADLRFVVTMDGKGLQTFLNERTNFLDTMAEEVFKALHLSLDPAKLVLDSIQGFYPPHLKKGSIDFDTNVIRKSCILLLDQLAKISPNIHPHVRDEAIKIANEWKKKLKIDNILEVLGFLHLLASYKLASVFDAEEITISLGSVAHHQQMLELCRRLGFANESRDIIQILLRKGLYVEAVNFIYAFDVVPSKAFSASSNSSRNDADPPQPLTVILANMNGKELFFFLKEHIEEHELLSYHISSAIKLSNDSAGLVLNAIKELCDSLHKEENKNEASGKWKSCILLLKQMRSVDIREEMKEEARKLAVELKEKIESGTRNPIVVIGFLLFMSAFGVNPFLDNNELLGFYTSGCVESSLPQCVADVLQPLTENSAENIEIDSTSMIPFIRNSPDPASLVLDSLMSCYSSMRGKLDRFELVARSFFQLLQELMKISPEIKSHVKDKAKIFCFNWKSNWSLSFTGQASSWEALAFLQFISCYNLPFSFNDDELRFLHEAAYMPKEAIPLFRSLSLTDKIPSFISKLVENEQWLLALTFSCEFNLVDQFPPVPILKNHILSGKKLAQERCAEGNNTVEAQDNAIRVEISAIKAAVRCIRKYGLENEFHPDELVKQISKLQQKMMSSKSSVPLKPSTSKQQQQQLASVNENALPVTSPEEVTRKRSALTAGIIQPLNVKRTRISRFRNSFANT